MTPITDLTFLDSLFDSMMSPVVGNIYHRRISLSASDNRLISRRLADKKSALIAGSVNRCRFSAADRGKRPVPVAEEC